MQPSPDRGGSREKRSGADVYVSRWRHGGAREVVVPVLDRRAGAVRLRAAVRGGCAPAWPIDLRDLRRLGAIEDGGRLRPPREQPPKLQLADTTTFRTGVVVLCYGRP